ncbi:MAG: hypothetical protein F4Y57_03500 [Acidobacteria bacterium]|nr:hypothetical protein [Acidobacteriota bacterium]
MGCRISASLVILGVVAVLAAALPAAGQGAPEGYAAPRTPWGDPDLQGIWTNTTTTPFERPEEFGERQFLTDEEFAAAQADALRREQDVAS